MGKLDNRERVLVDHIPGQRYRDQPDQGTRERELFTDNLLVRIHLIIGMIWWTGLAPWVFEFPFPGSFIFTFLEGTYQGSDSGSGVNTIVGFHRGPRFGIVFLVSWSRRYRASEEGKA